jgi:DNA helicase II / ATP-dependent DNA helicase PcrA
VLLSKESRCNILDFFNLLSNQYKISLNEQQKAAVSHKSGPALVLAGPGSGKTTVITARTAFLCLEAGVDPRNILTMTFNRAATHDMKSRYDRIYGESVGQVRFSTMHSLCYQILHDYEERQGQKFRLIESEDVDLRKEQVLRSIYENVNKARANDDELELLVSEIGLVKNRMIKDSKVIDSITSTQNFGAIYKAYEDYKRENCLIDYDDMLTFAYLILHKCPDILLKYKRRYQYIQVDEGQDLSKIQFEIVSLLIDKDTQNLFVVADDDQSIYAFRGAEPEYILNIQERMPACNFFKLEKNYRSSKNIVEMSSQFIKKNLRRFDKNHNTENAEIADPSIVGVEDEAEQIQFLFQKITEIQEENPESSIAVIYRNNLSSIALVDALERKQCHFKIRQSKLHFFNHWIVQDVLALLRFSIDQTDAEAFERIYYKIKRYISKAMIEFAGKTYYKESYLNAILGFPNLQPFQIRQFTELKNEFRKLSLMKPADAVDYIETAFNYGEYMREFCEKTRTSYPFICNIYGILKTIAAGCNSVPDFMERVNDLDELLQSNSLSSRKANLTLTTLHSSKGLEFDHVLMIDLTNDEIPGVEMKGDENTPIIEEERRLFYVGMTRARKMLTLVYPKVRGGVPQRRSAFINEVAVCLHISEQSGDGEIGEGVIINHKKLGTGIIENVKRQGESVYITVSFGGLSKTLDYNICKQNGLISVVE